MGEMIPDSTSAIPLFNSALETGLRALVVLDALHPRACSTSELVWFDHLVVHTSDLEGPDSLHPDLPSRTGELLVRRRLVDEGVRLLLQAELVNVVDDEEGMRYQAGEEAPSFLDLLAVPYAQTLKNRAHWLADHLGALPEAAIRDVVHRRLGRWTLEFQGEETLHEPAA
ncbi:hypothetical protein HHL26_01170 [Sphingobium sp. TB-6]|uniref:ABC-three component system middle component 2 n=1 Tax=Sphingobium sp. TB-6 TaxID=2728850 RepID=UPI00146DD7DB|nr:ABC-three component system middle component 2 [Sphingobium sp. TB-6]NML87681.1 hypothetical protein [Sphingobium sp. TB-6]